MQKGCPLMIGCFSPSLISVGRRQSSAETWKQYISCLCVQLG